MPLVMLRSALRSSLLIALAALAACAGAGKAGPGARTGATAPSGSPQTVQPVGKGSGPTAIRQPAPGPGRAPTFAPCPDKPCMLHAGRGRYHECLHAGAGQCFHYGAPCAPSDQCMFDRAGAQYRKCQRVRGGECVTFGASCEPGGHCMVDPRDGVHRTCDQFSDGRCERYGAPCTPKS